MRWIVAAFVSYLFWGSFVQAPEYWLARDMTTPANLAASTVENIADVTFGNVFRGARHLIAGTDEPPP